MTSPSPESPPLDLMSDLPAASWQAPRRSPAARRLMQLACGVGLLITLTLGLSFVLVAPFRHPQVHVLVLSGEMEVGLWPQKLPAARPTPDAPALLDAMQFWTESTKLPAPRLVPGLSSGQTLDRLFQLATAPEVHSGDVALCVVQSQIAAIEDTVYLVDRLDPTDPVRGRVPFKKFCDSLRASTAGTKLLCLDAGQLSADPRSGMILNNFGERLQKAVEDTADPHLWVLVSHAAGQRSQAAEGRTPTVFLDAVARGLQREADQNGDRRISLVELVSFVQRETAEYARGENLAPETQTPWLIRGAGAWTESDLNVALAPVARRPSQKPSAAAPPEATPHPTAKQEASAPATKDGAASTATRPVISMTVPELLKEAWELRDVLEQGSPFEAAGAVFRPCDYAPCHWNRLLAELLQAEAIWASQPNHFPPRIHVLLQMRTADLRTLAAGSSAPGSDWLNELRRLQPRPSGEVDGALSLTMAERWRRWTNSPSTEQDSAERTVLNSVLAAMDSQPLSQWMEKKPANFHAELRFALRLSSQPGLDWSQVRETLRVRCEAEDLACRPVAVRWFAEDLSRADRLRWYGERKLLDGTRPDKEKAAQQSLREAATIYQQTAQATQRVELARRLECDLLSDLPHWMALSRNHSLAVRSSLCRELTPLIPDLREMIEALANARKEECSRIEQLRRELQQRQDRIRALLFPDVLFGQLSLAERSTGELRLLAQALLETPLPSAPERQSLRKFLTVPAAGRSTPPATAPHVSSQVLATVEPDHELESRYCRLLQPLKPHVAAGVVCWTLGSAVPNPTPRKSGGQPPNAKSEEDHWLRTHIALPGELAKSLPQDSASRTMAATAWQHTLLLADPRDEIPLTVESGNAALCLQRIGNVIDWQWHQATLALSDAPASESGPLQETIDQLRSLLTNAFSISRPSASPKVLRVTAPDAVDLNSVREQTVSLVVRNQRSEPCPIRYVIDHDPSLLDIETDSGICLLASKDPHTDFRMTPYEAAAQPATTRLLPAGGNDELRLKLRGNLSEAPTRLVVHVIADQSTVRQDIAIDLPRMPLGLVQATPSANVSLAADPRELRPFANRTTTYNLSLRGTGRHSAKLDVTAYRVTAPTVIWPASSTLPSGELQNWLSRTAELKQIGALQGLAVAEDTTVPLLFPAVKADPQASLDLSGGLLIVMSDASRKLSTWQHVSCAPLRPSAYVESMVDYDPVRETLRVVVRPRDGFALPAEGVPVRFRIVEFPDRGRAAPLRLESGSARSLDAMLQPHRRDATLAIPYRRPSGAAYVLIDVDSWPRAFVFAIAQDGAREATDLAVEVLDPTRRAAVRAPVDAIPATIAVTLPTPYVPETDLVEVGVDRDGDRRLDGEPTVRLSADRQSGVVLESIDAGGTWTLRTTVRDWTVMIPARGMSDQWGAVLARVVRGPQEVWSGGTSIAFDKGGPVLSRITVSDDGEPTIGQPVQITARADDFGLSGVATVSAGIDPSGLGVISPGAKLVEAASTGDGEWSVTVPTAKVPPGPAVIVMQATDFVGNVGPVKVVPIRCLTADQAAAKLAARTFPVLGTVNYAGEAVREAEVRLTLVLPKDAAIAAAAKPPFTTKTNRWGQFAFDSVPPGQYDLTAKGTVRGFRYESRTPVTVAPTKDPGPIKLVFGKAEK